MAFTVRNHYVPIWYQRRFLTPGQTKYWYLDLRPDPILRPGLPPARRRSTRNLGPVNCFRQDHLYTEYFGDNPSDAMEKIFFGKIDSTGERAIKFFADYQVTSGMHEAFSGTLDYLSAQLFRTPKGLRILQTIAGTKDHQQLLLLLRKLWRFYQTIWCEGVWEIVRCEASPTKFIVSDSPVTTYNKQIYPGSAEARDWGMAQVERIGTHTIFPLSIDRCLVITNLQYVRNPKANPLRYRENPRYFAGGLFDLRKIQRGREISEQDVICINWILKSNSQRYIAAADPRWLAPENQIKLPPWPKLGGRFFLMPDPRKVTFTTGIVAGFQDGGGWAANEYGHHELENPRAIELREKEWRSFHAAKKAWDDADKRAGREPPKDINDYF